MKFLFIKFRYYWFLKVLKREGIENAKFKSKGITLFIVWIFVFIIILVLDILIGLNFSERLNRIKVNYFTRIWIPILVILILWYVLHVISSKYRGMFKFLHPFKSEFEEYIQEKKQLTTIDLLRIKVFLALIIVIPLIVVLFNWIRFFLTLRGGC